MQKFPQGCSRAPAGHLSSLGLGHRPLAELAAEAGISLRCAYKWLARYRSGGPASLADRRSVRRTHLLTLDPNRLQRAVELRQQRLHLRHIARLLAAPFSTVARTLSRLGLGRLRNLGPRPLECNSGGPVTLSGGCTGAVKG